MLGDGLLTTDGDFHRQQRRLIQPAFHKQRVEGYAGIMVQHTQEMLDEWRPGARIDVAQAMRDLTLRIVAKSLFGVDLKQDHSELGAAFTNVIENSACRLRNWRPACSWRRSCSVTRRAWCQAVQ